MKVGSRTKGENEITEKGGRMGRSRVRRVHMESANSSFGACLLELQGVSLSITENIAMSVKLVCPGQNRIYYSEYSNEARQKTRWGLCPKAWILIQESFLT
jgi:hypothetical protein